MSEVVNMRTGELVGVSPQEQSAVARLTVAIEALTDTVNMMPLAEVVDLKPQLVTIQVATRELGMSKDAEDLAGEAVRRCEWKIGRLIREGQEAGEIASQGGARRSTTATPTLPSPTDFATKQELSGAGHQQPGIYALADAATTAADFDAALAEAKAEGNLSRANVARKAREASGAEPKPRRRPLTDVARDVGWDARKLAEKVQRLSDDDRFSANAEQVASHLRSHLTYAIEVYQDLLDRINNN